MLAFCMRKEIGIAASAFTLTSAIGVALTSPESHCSGPQRFTARDNVVVCETPEGIEVQGKNTPSWLLPESVTNVIQVWGYWNNDKFAGYYTEEGGCNITYHKLNLETGEEEIETYCIPWGYW